MTITADEAIARLREGNRRFAAGDMPGTQTQEQRLLTEANPFAIVLGCSDSRVPVETIFSQDIGDLFVIRVAGHVASRTQIGSIEFALEAYSPPVVVVLGHSRCGAVATALRAVDGEPPQSPHLLTIIDAIRPAVTPADDPEERLDGAIRANVHGTVAKLKNRSALIGTLVDAGKLRIVGARYSLDTGIVEFLDER